MSTTIAKNAGCAALVGCAALLLTGCSREPAQTESTPAAETATAQAPAADPNCAPSGPLNYVCGLKNAEDIVQLGSSDWLIVSGLSPLNQPASAAPGRIYLLNHKTKAHEEWFPGAAPALQHDKQTFGVCPGPVNTANFSPHGLALREQAANRYRLYMTSHGEREAIEVFEIDASGARPAIAWVGCVVLPEKTFANSVAVLADGGFVTTKMMDPTVPNPFAEVTAGKITGHVYEWHPGGAVTAVVGTELAGANGIELSPDQRWLFVAAIGSGEVVRYDRNAKPLAKQAVKVDIRPDNLRWGASGKLYTVGGNLAAAECASPPCATGWSVYEIDPQTMQATRVAGADPAATLQGASTALPIGNEIWIGTFSGDRVGYLSVDAAAIAR
jgi:hypothetical protein